MGASGKANPRRYITGLERRKWLTPIHYLNPDTALSMTAPLQASMDSSSPSASSIKADRAQCKTSGETCFEPKEANSAEEMEQMPVAWQYKTNDYIDERMHTSACFQHRFDFRDGSSYGYTYPHQRRTYMKCHSETEELWSMKAFIAKQAKDLAAKRSAQYNERFSCLTGETTCSSVLPVREAMSKQSMCNLSWRQVLNKSYPAKSTAIAPSFVRAYQRHNPAKKRNESACHSFPPIKGNIKEGGDVYEIIVCRDETIQWNEVQGNDPSGLAPSFPNLRKRLSATAHTGTDQDAYAVISKRASEFHTYMQLVKYIMPRMHKRDSMLVHEHMFDSRQERKALHYPLDSVANVPTSAPVHLPLKATPTSLKMSGTRRSSGKQLRAYRGKDLLREEPPAVESKAKGSLYSYAASRNIRLCETPTCNCGARVYGYVPAEFRSRTRAIVSFLLYVGYGVYLLKGYWEGEFWKLRHVRTLCRLSTAIRSYLPKVGKRTPRSRILGMTTCL